MHRVAKFWLSVESGDVVRLQQFGERVGTSASSAAASWREASDRMWDDEWRPVDGREDGPLVGDVEWFEVWARLDDPPGPNQLRLLRKRGGSFEVCTSVDDVEQTFSAEDAATRRLAEFGLTLITSENNTVGA